MAIQIPNPGTGNGQTGDNEFVLWSKVKDNFTDTTHAASRLVGVANGQIPLAEDAHKACLANFTSFPSNGINLDDLAVGTRTLINANSTNIPAPTGIFLIETVNSGGGAKMQVSYSWNETIYIRVYQGVAWGAWRPLTRSEKTYTTTTAAGANVVVDADGTLKRSTSSERYKNILADLVLDDSAYDNAMSLAPIIYRSTADSDNPDYHFYSFSAEVLGALDPAFTLWRDTEIVTDSDGISSEKPLAEPVADGINLNAIVAFLHATNVKQGELISALEDRVAALEKE